MLARFVQVCLVECQWPLALALALAVAVAVALALALTVAVRWSVPTVWREWMDWSDVLRNRLFVPRAEPVL